MSAGKLHFKSDAGGITSVSREAGATNGELVLPASGTVASVSSAVTDNAIARYDSTTGKLQNSAITIDDSGNIGSGAQSFNGFGGTGFKNYIINGNFDVWQRGTSQTAGGYGSADRWFTQFDGNCTLAYEQVAYNNTAKLSWTSAGTYKNFLTSIEDGARKLQGKTVTVSFMAKAATAGTCSTYVGRGIGAGISAGIDSVSINLTTSWQKITRTFTMPIYDNANMTLVVGLISMQLLGASNTVWIKEVQIEEGSIATPFENRPYGLELSLCQRYCFNPKHGADGANQVVRGDAYGVDSVNGWINFKFPVSMREAPYLYLSGGTSSLYLGYPEAIPLTALSQAIVSCNEAIYAYSVASGNTAFKHYNLYLPNAGHKILFISEL